MIRMSKNITRNLSKISNFKEIEIPVPWGHISAKKYSRLQEVQQNSNSNSNSSNTNNSLTFDKTLPILCFHGWLDNSGTFDRLIPLIHDQHPDLEFICIDWPGHGKSSHRPDGTYVNSYIYLSDIARIQKSLNLKNFNAMGHSLGGNAILQYACVYPDVIKNLIRLDANGIVTNDPKDWLSSTARSIKQQLDYESTLGIREPNKYTYEQAKARLLKGTIIPSSIYEDSLDFMLERGLKDLNETDEKTGQKLYTFSRDVKLMVGPAGAYTREMAFEILKGHKNCHHNELAIMASDNAWYKRFIEHSPDQFQEDFENNYPMTFFEGHGNVNFQLVLAEGNHHVHLNCPEVFIDKLCGWIENPADSSGTTTGREYMEYYAKQN